MRKLPARSVIAAERRLLLRSPAFELDAANGLPAARWRNRLTGSRFPLGRGMEVGLWAGTHVFLPADLAGKPLTLVLGRFGLFGGSLLSLERPLARPVPRGRLRRGGPVRSHTRDRSPEDE